MCPGPLAYLTRASCTHTIFGRSGVALLYMCKFMVFITCVYTKMFDWGFLDDLSSF